MDLEGIEILFRNWNFVQKSKSWLKIEILVKNQNFRRKWVFLQNLFCQFRYLWQFFINLANFHISTKNYLKPVLSNWYYFGQFQRKFFITLGNFQISTKNYLKPVLPNWNLFGPIPKKILLLWAISLLTIFGQFQAFLSFCPICNILVNFQISSQLRNEIFHRTNLQFTKPKSTFWNFWILMNSNNSGKYTDNIL